MSGRTLAGALLAIVVIAGGIFLGVGAYNAGVTQGLIESGQIASPGPHIGGPYVGWGYGWGGPGFGFFGFLGALFFIFLVIALIRVAFGRGRGWGGPGGWDRGPGGFGPSESRARQMHDEWHRTEGSRSPADRDQSAT